MRGHGKSYHADDEILGKVYDHTLMRRLFGYARPYYAVFALGLFLVLVSTACFLAGPRLIGLIIDLGIKPRNFQELYSLSALYLAVMLLSWLTDYVSTYVLAYLGQKIMFDLRARLFSHLQKMSLRFFDKNPVGRLVTRVTNDIGTLSELFSVGLITVFQDVVMLIGLIIVMWWMDIYLTLIALSIALFLIPLTFFFKVRIRNAYRDIRIKLARINAYIAENVAGIRITKLFNREDKNQELFNDINKEHFDACYRSIKYDGSFISSVTIMRAVSIGLVLYYGGSAVFDKVIELGVLVTFLTYTMHFFDPIQDLADKYTLFQSAMASAERVFKIMDTPEDIVDAEKPIPLPAIKGEIKFEDVWFAYPSDENKEAPPLYVLKNISFSVKPGESIAIVGITGSGKSTIINLLSRFYDVGKGRILIDGVDIRNLRQSELRKQMGIVLQDVFLFSGTVLDNICLGEKNISLEKCREIAKYVHADTFIEQLPNQYEGSVAERGVTFSTGQRQLLSFTRALVFDPRILILDEATSSIDVETESYIQDAIKKVIKGRTSIIIAHRLSTIKNVDRILVIHHGELKEMGTHRELLERKGIYYKLYKLQFKA
ncbi:MAG: ABC transporter ATP-binding protein [Planctomycetes bacterium]|nr:ABC transporter ATP-binding protein [Planctomycetota bacterium]